MVRNGRVILMRGALQDITERKQSELHLQSQLQRMQPARTHHARHRRAAGSEEHHADRSSAPVEEQLPLDFGCICLYDPAQP